MAVTTVLFDLDGTLLPMDQDVFLKEYFKSLAAKAAANGYDTDGFTAAVLAGLGAMMKNDGKISNEAAFMAVFGEAIGGITQAEHEFFDSFYKNDFDKLRLFCGSDPDAQKTVRAIKDRGLRTVLATNPVFPADATHRRISWAGLDRGDFEYITTYENSSYSKPSPCYYEEILNKLGLGAEECLMVGNDVDDDMPAAELGMKVFLLTPCLINRNNADISAYPNGGFAELYGYIKSITV